MLGIFKVTHFVYTDNNSYWNILKEERYVESKRFFSLRKAIEYAENQSGTKCNRIHVGYVATKDRKDPFVSEFWFIEIPMIFDVLGIEL